MDAIKAACHTTFHATRHSGVRPLNQVYWVVMHDTEGGTAAGIARYFAQPVHGGEPGGSAHLVVDNDHCYRCLKNAQIPWGSSSSFGANTHGFHIEQCGYARWTTAEWMRHKSTLERGAFKAALHCHLFNIPPRFVNAAGLVAGHHGITTHAEVSKASKFQDPANASRYSHTDPGTGWPRLHWLDMMMSYYVEFTV